jgi:hypothetical protein
METQEKSENAEFVFPAWLATNHRGELTQEQRDEIKKWISRQTWRLLLIFVLTVVFIALCIFFAVQLAISHRSLFVPSLFGIISVFSGLAIIRELQIRKQLRGALSNGKVSMEELEIAQSWWRGSFNPQTGETVSLKSYTTPLILKGRYRLYFLTGTNHVVSLVQLDPK